LTDTTLPMGSTMMMGGSYSTVGVV
jgi:hypothetical protein